MPDEYVTLVQALAEDEQLNLWFASLAAMPANRRHSELGRVAVRFTAAGQERLARIIQSLNDERIYRIVKEVVAATRR